MAAPADVAAPVSAQVVGNAFVEQYYHILHQSPGLVHKFYHEDSKLGRPEEDGTLSLTTTMDKINAKILSLNYEDFKAEIKTVGAQESSEGGVNVLVTGHLTGKDNLVHDFTQSFFLAPQDKSYFVLNDMFRYMDKPKHTESTPNEDVVLDPVPNPEQEVPPVSEVDNNTPDQSADVAKEPQPEKIEENANPRGGGGGGGGGRGRGWSRGGGVRTCFGCGELGHIIRDCPATASFPRSNTRRGNQAFGNDPSVSDAIESTSGTSKYTLKPLNAFTPVDITPLLSKIRDKEQELKLSKEQNADLNMRLNKTTKELTSIQTKNKEVTLNMNKLKEDLEKIRNELSSARKKETEVSQMYSVMKNKFEELEEANEAADNEMEKLKAETEQWRKAAKAIAVVFNGGEVISSKTPELESLVLYYTNRAAKRMSLGKIRKALDDCTIAARLDPSFLKVSLTAGNCHLKLGELDDAIRKYKKCLESGAVCLDRRLTIEASEGLQNAQKVVSCLKRSAELLQQKTSESAMEALDIIMEVSLLSCYSEKLLQMKVDALFLLQKYDQVIQLCEKSLPSAESNCGKNHNSNEGQNRHLKLWRWCMMARCYFRMGNFDMALATLEKYEQLSPDQTKSEDSSSFSAATVSELLRCKSAGNEAYKSGKHKEAVKHYTKALQMSIESKSFAAICLCNRAAAHQALDEVIDAMADCNLAIALDNNYLKAISRRVNLHEKIRDYEHASLDLHRLITLLEKKSVEKHVDLTIARRRLSSVDKHLKKGLTLDLYLILGLKGSESGAEIKKAYHKAALRHHPDKAGKFLRTCESGEDGGVWKEIYETIHKDADKLFKIIGEAYAVLSDANKRFKYNLEDAMNDDDFPS